MRIGMIAVFAMAALAGCASGSTTGGSGMRYLALGDSYTIGEGAAEADRWPVQLAGLLHVRNVEIEEPRIIAVTGWTTDELSTAIDQENPRGPFALVSLLIGVNNQYRGRGAEEYRVQFAALLQRAIGFAGGDAGRVIVLSIPDWGVTPFAEGRDRAQIATEIDLFNRINREETQRLGARYVDITPQSRAIAGTPGAFAPDGLHYSGTTYAEWARLALPSALAATGAAASP
ncbi:lysophospholipase L1-like esterase [Longimicrobium terrae]|uniref:Lysophospholipase L1-like esterase n=2 Tax=Longimicrobium terrae TaxID=1639882 RepID=A0A841H435_9BACT|nr:SGNH/GDSL hydrolase family protein [Longimicrobium terrae]MBB4638419.1 lysophospholipase L1-like esterase [Longimicrobium terrae]MBB6072738.1 lysophospholipase L1-like esterase [Longimicrobium terrae]